MRRTIAILAVCVLAACRERAERIDDAARPPSSALSEARTKLRPLFKNRPRSHDADQLLPKDSIWRSRSACENALAQRKRLARAGNTARLGTWNVRWYPDGRPGRRASGEGGTDIAWLACAIAWMDVDALAVQEFKAHARAEQRSAELVRALDRHTGGSWKLALDDCRGGDAGQHVGIVYDQKRVRASAPIVVGALNPHGDACRNQLRPGLGLRLQFVGGLDLYFVSAHLKSGPDRRALDLRARSIDALPTALSELAAHGREQDVVIAGDFNTMGCRRCSPPVSAADELAQLTGRLNALETSFRRVEPTVGCTEYFSRGTGLLDHFLVTTASRELPTGARASVSGYCGEAACKVLPQHTEPSVSGAISDHCPVVLDLADRDLD